MILKKTAIAALGGVFLLGACTDPGQINDPNNPNRKQQQGVLLGAGVGAALGQIAGGDTKATVAGAMLGAAAGGLIGHNLDKQEAELRQTLGDDRIKIVNTGDRLIVTMPQDILFPTDSSTVSSALYPDLQAVSRSLQNYPDTTVQVIGHTDNTGEAAYNQSLSERRAGAVASILINSGTSAGRVVTIGRGENQPIASNLTVEGRAQNRRVEIVILPNA